jgi:hypothetical protein
VFSKDEIANLLRAESQKEIFARRADHQGQDLVQLGTGFLLNQADSCLPFALNQLFGYEIFGSVELFNKIQRKINPSVSFIICIFLSI